MTEIEQTRKERHEKKKNKGIFIRIIKWLFILLLGLIITGVGVFAFYANKAPKITKADMQNAGSSTIYAQDGKKLLTLGNQERDYASIDEIPKKLQNAVISIEDRRFYKEPLGIDPIRIMTSAASNVKSGGIKSGGSTLTQQLIKLSKFSTKRSDQNLKRKIQEAWLAIQVEQRYSKKKILEFYMNKVYLSNGIYGMKTASKYYFHKNLTDLTLGQTALLAGMPQSPNDYDPYTHPEKAKQRRDNVLLSMYNNKKISKEEMMTAVNTPINDGLFAKKNTSADTTIRKVSDPYIKEVIGEVRKKGYDPYRDNLKITTNMNYDAQQYLYDIANSTTYMSFPNSSIQVASTVVDPKTGKVIAMLGGRNQGDVQLGYNRAVESSRSNGSTMKPLLDYAPAIEYLSWSTYHPLADEPYVYPGTSINLHDVDNQYFGDLSLRQALSKSRNIPAVKTLNAVGFTRAKKFVKQMGINIPDDAGLSAGIGSGASTLQNAAAYSAFANGGYYRKPYYVSKIETSDGIAHNYNSSAKRVMKESTAFMITDVLKEVVKDGGLGQNAAIPNLYQAGKTGTTDYSSEEIATNPALYGQAKDAWFDGYTKNYSMSVWTGYDKPIENGLTLQDRTISQHIYKYMMSYLQQNDSNTDWTAPGDIIKQNGEWFLSGTLPSKFETGFVSDNTPVTKYTPSTDSQAKTYTPETDSEASDNSDNSINTTTDENPDSSATDTDSDTKDSNAESDSNNKNSNNTNSDSNSTDNNTSDTNNNQDSNDTKDNKKQSDTKNN